MNVPWTAIALVLCCITGFLAGGEIERRKYFTIGDPSADALNTVMVDSNGIPIDSFSVGLPVVICGYVDKNGVNRPLTEAMLRRMVP